MSVAKVGKAKRRPAKTRAFNWDAESVAAFIDAQCKTRKSTLAFFKKIGLTYNERGEPVVVPK